MNKNKNQFCYFVKTKCKSSFLFFSLLNITFPVSLDFVSVDFVSLDFVSLNFDYLDFNSMDFN